jgi:hypothetical protein
MKYLKLIASGALIFFLGYIMVMLLGILLYMDGGSLALNSSIFNAGVRGIIIAILLLNSSLITCTYLILKALKK